MKCELDVMIRELIASGRLHVDSDRGLVGNGRHDGVRDKLGRFGKKAAGRTLDGRTWDEFPEAKAQ